MSETSQRLREAAAKCGDANLLAVMLNDTIVLADRLLAERDEARLLACRVLEALGAPADADPVELVKRLKADRDALSAEKRYRIDHALQRAWSE